MIIRAAVERDIGSINDIYNHYVACSTCTFHLEAVSVEERVEWLLAHTDKYPVLVAESEGEVVGWASLSEYKPRPAYRFSVESSVYVRHDQHRKGLGRLLMNALIQQAEELGYHTIIAGVTSDQSASIKLHESLGFVQVAHFREVGFKFDEWRDVVYYQLFL